MATAKQRAWRAKFARLYGGGRKKTRRKRHKGGNMGRRKHYHRGGGIGSLFKSAAVGAIGGALAPKIPVVNGLPYSRAFAGAGLNYLLGGKGMKKILVAGAAGQFLGGTLSGGMSSATGGAW